MIPVRNVYYMLAYAFQSLHSEGFRKAGSESFRNTADLLAAILAMGVSTQVRRGLRREYITREEALTSPRGKLEITASIRAQTLRKKQLLCTCDEFSPNAYVNRIIKTAMLFLLKADIPAERKRALRKLLPFFEAAEALPPRRINWRIRYDRNNQTYRMLIAICRFAIRGLLQTTADGTIRVRDYADDRSMNRLYEKFILAYFRRDHPELKTWTPQIPWQVTDGYRQALPVMQSDVVIASRTTGKTLIIDAKYYAHSMQRIEAWDSHTIHSHNLYQIFTYVKNWNAAPGERVAGMLLYARTDDEIQPDGDYQMSGHTISVKTLDLNRDFPAIAAQLDAIAERVNAP